MVKWLLTLDVEYFSERYDVILSNEKLTQDDGNSIFSQRAADVMFCYVTECTGSLSDLKHVDNHKGPSHAPNLVQKQQVAVRHTFIRIFYH